MKPLNLEVVDFFSGCGGTSIGLTRAGLKVKVAIDLDKNALENLSMNLPNVVTIHKDIRDLNFSDLEPLISNVPKLFVACAPCQPFSNIKRRSDKVDARVDLLLEFTRFVEHFLPEYILIENVPGIKNSNKDGPLPIFLNRINDLGYNYALEVLDASDFGVPQRRKRLIVIASLYGNISLPTPRKTKAKTVKNAIGHLPPIMAGETHQDDPLHRAAALTEINLKRIAYAD